MDFGDESVLIPDVVEPILGWRAWDILDHVEVRVAEDWTPHMIAEPSDAVIPIETHTVLRLASRMGGDKWPLHTPLRARCYYHNCGSAACSIRCSHSPSPTTGGHEGFGCGIYAYKSPEQAAMLTDPARAQSVWGAILMWGTVYEHEFGYRCQYAQPMSLSQSATNHRHVRELAKLYGASVVQDLRDITLGLPCDYPAKWDPSMGVLETDYRVFPLELLPKIDSPEIKQKIIEAHLGYTRGNNDDR